MFCRFFCSKSRELNLKMEITYQAMMDVCIIRDHLRRSKQSRYGIGLFIRNATFKGFANTKRCLRKQGQSTCGGANQTGGGT